MKCYHPALVTLHWLLAVIVLFVLLFGGDIPLKIHLALGGLIGGLFTIRFGIKRFSIHPSFSDNKSSLNRLAKVAHNVIYGLVFAVVASGIGIAIEADLLGVIQSNGALPDNFSDIPILCAHRILTKILLVVVSIHIVAAIFHQLVLRDSLFSRMWFGKR